ncbi:MAG: porin [Flammeovirgaceae bacterium]
MFQKTYCQIINTATIDTSEVHKGGKVLVGGYIDAYYAYDFSEPDNNLIPYYVSSNKHNTISINLAYIDVKYSSEKLKARLVPAWGTYMNANYANEEETMKNILEASVGIKVSKKRNIWIEGGVFGSPYTNESAISKDHLMYTRSFAPEYVPYYLVGVKLSVPLSPKIQSCFYFLNGWQQIKDLNSQKSIGTQIEYRPNNQLLINWNTYIGDERSETTPDFRMRYFSDVYVLFNPTEKFSATACVYGGIQKKKAISGEEQSLKWWQVNLIGSYRFSSKMSVAGRIEYFHDGESVQVVPITPLLGFKAYSSSLCLNIKAMQNALFRLESKSFYAEDKVFLDKKQIPSSMKHLLVTNLTIWF